MKNKSSILKLPMNEMVKIYRGDTFRRFILAREMETPKFSPRDNLLYYFMNIG
jgi:hypothetical protein